MDEKNSAEDVEKTCHQSRNTSSEPSDKWMQIRLPCEWVDFKLNSLNANQVAFKSMQSILSRFEDEEFVRGLLSRRCWDITLEKAAVNVVLNFCEIFEPETKTEECSQEIFLTIERSMEKILNNTELNKVSHHIEHITILLEFIHSKRVCVKTINYLFEKLKSHKMADTSSTNENFNPAVRNQLDLLFYALNKCLKMYQLHFPGNEENEGDDLEFIDVLKKQFKQCTSENLIKKESTKMQEQRWIRILEEFGSICLGNYEHFEWKSRSLLKMLLTMRRQL